MGFQFSSVPLNPEIPKRRKVNRRAQNRMAPAFMTPFICSFHLLNLYIKTFFIIIY